MELKLTYRVADDAKVEFLPKTLKKTVEIKNSRCGVHIEYLLQVEEGKERKLYGDEFDLVVCFSRRVVAELAGILEHELNFMGDLNNVVSFYVTGEPARKWSKEYYESLKGDGDGAGGSGG